MTIRFTQLMTWLHTWIGLLSGWLLFAVFLTGTLTVFDQEITSWMQPELHEITSDPGRMSNTAPWPARLTSQPGLENPDVSSGSPLLHMVKLQEKRTFSGQTVDPITGRLVTFRDTQGGDFFYHFHYGLLFGWPGAWMVAGAAIMMLITLFTGVVSHRWLFRDIVMLRLRLSHPRAWLDTHNLTGILFMPFHLMMSISGLVIFWSMYMPVNITLLREQDGKGLVSLFSLVHFAQFGGSPIRWLYFLMGLAATVMIATGLVLWISTRQKSQAGLSRKAGYRLVEVFTVAIVAGLPVAVAAFFWANRLLPLALYERSLWEIRCFFLVWGLCLLHSSLRQGSILAWRDQLYAASFLLGCLPLLNGITTNTHVLISIPRGQWEFVGVDLTGLALGGALGWIGRLIGQRPLKDLP